MKYVVEGDGKSREVGAGQRSLDVTGLTNGQPYTFTVYAVNAKGNGPKRAANPVVPTSEVPDPPASVTAAENKDGTVTVTWPAANGQGRGIARYVVSAISAGGAPVQVGETDKTTLTIPAGPQLTYGTQYAFTVTSVNDRGANSKTSPVSNTVVPYAVPGKPAGLKARTATDQAGTVTVTWSAPPENGRPITRYVVSANGRTPQEFPAGTTSATLTGFGNGANVTVKVHAVNTAGTGPDAVDTATTVDKPTITVTGSSAASTTAISVSFSADLGGASKATCTLSADGKSASNNCGANSLTVNGLQPSRSYDFTVTVTTPAGSANAPGKQATQDVMGQAYCQNYTSSDPATRTWCDDPDNALEVQTNPAKLHAGQVGRRTVHTHSYKAICWTTGVEVIAYNYNHNKTTSRWIRIVWDDGKQYYTPLAWMNFGSDFSANYVGVLPAC
jgi:hypothetical protein